MLVGVGGLLRENLAPSGCSMSAILPLCRVLGHGFDLDEVPPPPPVKAPTLPSLEAYHPHGRALFPPTPVHQSCDKALPCPWFMPCPLTDGEFGEPRSQRGLDRYLDSLFDPVLSYGNGVRVVFPCLRHFGVLVAWSLYPDTCPPGAGEAIHPLAEAEGRRWCGRGEQ